MANRGSSKTSAKNSGGTAAGYGGGSTGTGSSRGGRGSGSKNSSSGGFKSHGVYKKRGSNYSKWGIYLPDWWRLEEKTRKKWEGRWKRSAKKRGGHEGKYHLSSKRFKKWVKKKRKRIEKEISWEMPGYKSDRQDYEKLQKKFSNFKEKEFGKLEKDYSTLRQQLGLGTGAAGDQQGWYAQAQQQQDAFNQQMAALQQQHQQQAADYEKQIQAFNVAQQQSTFANQMMAQAPTAVAPNTTASSAYNSRWFSRPPQQPLGSPAGLVDQSTNV